MRLNVDQSVFGDQLALRDIQSEVFVFPLSVLHAGLLPLQERVAAAPGPANRGGGGG